MLDGQVLYASALGPQPPQEAGITKELFPMFSIVYSDTLNSWQIGELCDHMNRIGTVRLAATRIFINCVTPVIPCA
jgi:hypothetical protein